MTRYTELTGCRVPVQQAPMGSVSTSALAVAVADAGGVGSITALGMTAAQVDDLLAGLAARTTGVLAANFLTGGIDPEAVAAAAARVRIVDFFWADPDPALVEVAHRGGALACSLGNLADGCQRTRRDPCRRTPCNQLRTATVMVTTGEALITDGICQMPQQGTRR